MTSTYVWHGDYEIELDDGDELVEPSEPRVFFVAVTPNLKKEVLEAGRSGLLGVDPTSLFPDIVGFANANGCSRTVPLLP